MFAVLELPFQLIKAAIYLSIRVGFYEALDAAHNYTAIVVIDTTATIAITLQALVAPLILLIIRYFRVCRAIPSRLVSSARILTNFRSFLNSKFRYKCKHMSHKAPSVLRICAGRRQGQAD